MQTEEEPGLSGKRGRPIQQRWARALTFLLGSSIAVVTLYMALIVSELKSELALCSPGTCPSFANWLLLWASWLVLGGVLPIAAPALILVLRGSRLGWWGQVAIALAFYWVLRGEGYVPFDVFGYEPRGRVGPTLGWLYSADVALTIWVCICLAPAFLIRASTREGRRPDGGDRPRLGASALLGGAVVASGVWLAAEWLLRIPIPPSVVAWMFTFGICHATLPRSRPWMLWMTAALLGGVQVGLLEPALGIVTLRESIGTMVCLAAVGLLPWSRVVHGRLRLSTSPVSGS